MVETIMNWDDSKKSFQKGCDSTSGVETVE